MVDPMEITLGYRDRLPKTALGGGYLGDGFPVCSELPPLDYLRAGTVYTLLADQAASGAGGYLKSRASACGGRIPCKCMTADGKYTTGTSGQLVGELSAMKRRCDADVACKLLHAFKASSDPNAKWRACQWQKTPPTSVPPNSYLSYNGPNRKGSGNADVLVKGLRKPFHAAPASALSAALCARDASAGGCTFPRRLVLNTTLACTGHECKAGAGTVRVVKVTEGGRTATYSRAPGLCVRYTFFNGVQINANTYLGARQMCGDPALAGVAGTACCSATTGAVLGTAAATLSGAECLFEGEAMTRATAEARCAATYTGGKLCAKGKGLPTDPGAPYDWGAPARACGAPSHPWWTRDGCSLKVQVHADGYVTLVDPVAASHESRLRQGNGQRFRVRWNAAGTTSDTTTTTTGTGTARPRYPTATAGEGCGVTGCVAASPLTCVCGVRVEVAAIFTRVADIPRTAAELRVALGAGATPPQDHGPGAYQACRTPACAALAGVVVHVRTDSTSAAGVLDASAIFEVSGTAPERRFLANRVSTVRVGTEATFSFRNTPSFMPYVT